MSIHLRTSGGAAAILTLCVIALAGCADGGSGSGTTTTSATGNGLATGGASTIYTIQQPATGNAYILQFPIGSSTNLAPTAALTPPATFYAQAVATDSTGEIYVGGYDENTFQGEVLVYSAGASGTATPVRTILGGYYYNASNATFVVPETMTVGSNGVLYIASFDQTYLYVTSLSSTANSLAVPLTQITGTSTQLLDPLGIAVDAAGNVYVSQDTNIGTAGQILVFASASTGNATPARIITTTSVPWGLAVDSGSNLYAALDNVSVSGNTYYSAGSVVEYAAGASGAATPTRTIAGTTSGVYIGFGLRVDAAGNIYVVDENPNSNTNPYAVLAFPPTANGNVAPPVAFNSSALNSPGTEIAIH